MTRLWVGVAVIAGCLAWAQAAPAQPPPGGPAPMPEPIPFGGGGDSGPNLAPGPLGPSTAPPVQGDCNSLPDDGTGAFPCKECCPECGVYFDTGFVGYRRQPIGNSFPLAVEDPLGLDTGRPPPPNSPVIQSFHQLKPHFNGGVDGALGYLWGDHAVEVKAFYLWEGNRTKTLALPGRIDSFFFNAPLGFEGDNGMFLQDDRLSSTFSSTLWGAEVNYRCSSQALHEAEWFVGVRYLDLDERVTSFFDDDGLTFPLANGQPDPRREALYSVRTHNHFVAPQLGFEWGHPICCCCLSLTLGFGAKGAWGGNDVDLERQLIRGDGFLGFDGRRSNWQFSHLYEINSFVDIHLLERCKVRLGYNALWFLHMSAASDQYDFNLQNTDGFRTRNSNVFFHGPVAELQFLF
jgi:hypothetical protein